MNDVSSQAYAPPIDSAAYVEGPANVSPWVKCWRWCSPWRLFAASLAVFALSALLLVLVPDERVKVIGPWCLGISTVPATLGAARGLLDMVILATRGKMTLLGFVALGLATVTNGSVAFVGFIITVISTGDFRRGRQIRRFGKVLLPNVAPLKWTQPSRVPYLAGAPEGVARRWIDNARTEHASVAAFARLTLDLMALGAPPELLKAAQEDAIDEIRHAELCLALARSLGGQELGFAEFPEARPRMNLPHVKALALSQLAVDSLIDGALHEGVSARVVARLARRCSEPGIVEVLREIARDEGRHAAHGWDVVRFCLNQGGQTVASALLGALRGLKDTHPGAKNELGGEDGSWEIWGLPGRALEEDEYARSVADLKIRVHALVEATFSKAA